MSHKAECSACVLAARSDLDIRLLAGESMMMLAQLFDVELFALQKHKRDHLQRLPIQLRDDPGTILNDLQRAEQSAWQVLKLAETAEKVDYKTMLAALREIRASKETQVKIAQQLQVMIGGLPQDRWERIKDAIAKALEPFEDARVAVIAAIEQVE